MRLRKARRHDLLTQIGHLAALRIPVLLNWRRHGPAPGRRSARVLLMPGQTDRYVDVRDTRMSLAGSSTPNRPSCIRFLDPRTPRRKSGHNPREQISPSSMPNISAAAKFAII